MAERGGAVRRPQRAPMPSRSKRRWKVAAGAAACWAVLAVASGSPVMGAVLFVLLAVAAGAAVLAARSFGLTGEHPWVRQLAGRPWRDGQEVLQLSLRHLHEVFVITPRGALLAPNVVELRLNPRDYGSLREVMDISLVDSLATEAYQEQARERGARFGGPGPVEVRVVSDPTVAPGRHTLRQGSPLDGGRAPAADWDLPPAPVPSGAPRGQAPRAPQAAPAVGHESAHLGRTLLEPTAVATLEAPTQAAIPALRLITGGQSVQTRVSGARAGRGAVELRLPDVPTVSREHARFTFADGQWRVANLGMNGLTLNGSPLEDERPLSAGDSIRWGRTADAPMSRVEIG